MRSARTTSRFGERGAYVDSSAFVKLVLVESESAAMRETLRRTSFASSMVIVTEFMRTTVRDAPDRMQDAVALLDAVTTVPLTRRLVVEAGRLPAPIVRALDAIHIATALRLQPHVRPFLTYDERQATVARALGLDVVSPT